MANIIKKRNPWKNIIFFSLTTIPFFSVYYVGTVYESVSVVEMVLKGFTNTGYFLIGFSLLLGPLGKFWNYFDKFLTYRKQLGIIGFMYALVHGVVGTIIYIFPNPDIIITNYWAVALGIIALYLFYICYAISEIIVIKTLGPKRWRRLIRYVSYTAFILATMHIYLAKLPVWQNYINSNILFPPLSLIIFSFGVFVLGFRFYVFIYDTFSLGHTTIKTVIKESQKSVD
jgi:DMSO/TMAO reductase YedYZ heme-binding membrane subunit